MKRKKRIIQVIFFISLFFIINGVADTSIAKSHPSETIISLGSVPEGFSIIPKSLKYSMDMKNITYVAVNEKKENIVRLNNTTSPVYYAVRPGTPLFGPVNDRHAYIAASGPKGKNVFVVIDGKPDPPFDVVDQFIFSVDESRYAYRAVKNKKQCVVVDGKHGPFYDGIPIKESMTFSPDSKHFAYVAFNNNRCFLVLDGKEQKKYNFIQDVYFSYDSKHIAYKARIEKNGLKEKWCLVYDGIESKIYDGLFVFINSYDSRHITFVALKERKLLLIQDMKEIAVHDRIGLPVYSPDSKHFACAFADGFNWHIKVDNTLGPSFDNVLKFYFSPDSSRYAYTAIDGKEIYCIVDGIQSEAYKNIKPFKFSLDSKRYAYSAADDEGARIVVDGKPGKIYKAVGEPYFSPDSKTVVYRAINKNHNKWVTVINGKEQPLSFYAIKDYHFSPDSKRLAYATMTGKGKTLFVVDGKEQPLFSILGMPAFSPDGKHIAYHVMTFDEKWHLVVDGKQLPGTYGGFMRGTPIIFDSNTHFHTIAMREPGPEFLRIEVDIP